MAVTTNIHSTIIIKKKTEDKIPRGYELVPPDGNYGWVVAFACVTASLVTSAALPTFSVLLYDLISLYETDTAAISWVPSIVLTTGLILGPVNTVILNTLGVRKSTIITGLAISFGMMMSYFVDSIELLCITYGIIVGFGVGLGNMCYPIALSQYFRKYYGVVTGFLSAGFAAARLVYTPFALYLLEEYESRTVFLIIGANTLIICIAGLFLEPVKKHMVLVPISDESKLLKNESNNRLDVLKHEEMTISCSNDFGSVSSICLSQVSTTITTTTNVTNDEVSCCCSCLSKEICGKIDFSLLSEANFYIISGNGILLMAIVVYSNLFLFALGVEKGNSPLELTSITSAKAVADIVSRIVGPYLITYFRLCNRKSYICLGFIHGIILLAIVFIDSYDEIMIWSVTTGIVFGAASSLGKVLIVETMGTQQLSSVLGLSNFIMGCFLLPVAPILGWIRDTTGSFVNIYLFLAILQFILIALWIIKPYLPQKRPKFIF